MRYTIPVMSRSKKLIIGAVCLFIVGGGIVLGQGNVMSPGSPSIPPTITQATNDEQKPEAFDKQKHSLNDPTSIWVIVNKKRPLDPLSYSPSDLIVPNVTLRSNITSEERQIRNEAAKALEKMFVAASKEGINLTVQSGYRSYAFQNNLYNRYVTQQGKAVADTQSARPGHSEHQTGLAVDIGGTSQPGCNVELCFSKTTEGVWLAARAYGFGFIIRYPEGQATTTGYIYEPWHIRYVGTELSNKLYVDKVLTLETFFDLGAAMDYN